MVEVDRTAVPVRSGLAFCRNSRRTDRLVSGGGFQLVGRVCDGPVLAARTRAAARCAAGEGGGAARWADPALSAAAEAAAGLAQRALELGHRVRLAVSDGQGSTAEAHGRARLPELLQLLAGVPHGGARPGAFAELVLREARQSGAGAVALVTARADAQLPAVLRGLPRGAARVVYVHGGGDALPEAVHGWKRQLEALGCRVTLLAAGNAAASKGGAGDAATGT